MHRSSFLSNWKHFLRNRTLRVEFISTLLIIIIIIYVFSRYLIYNEARAGAILDDPILRFFDAVNLNTLIFFSIYSSLVLGLIAFSFKPLQLMTAFQVYSLMVIFRMISMYLVPLEPPVGTIDLHDPIVFILGTGKKIAKDLFFSGHISTAFMLFQVAKNKYLKSYFLIATVVIGISVVLQKAHYTIDIFAGIIFSYVSYELIKSIQQKLHHNIKMHE